MSWGVGGEGRGAYDLEGFTCQEGGGGEGAALGVS